MNDQRHSRANRFSCRFTAFVLGVLVALSASPAASDVPIQQRPLSLGNNVPNNLFLVPSVEWPTILSTANFNLVGNVDVYDSNADYVGYFDSGKCYRYVYAVDEPDRYFDPVGAAAAGHACSGASKQWSGNFLNWAVTQTIDPFRKVLTGGYRVRDTVTETWLEKAFAHDSLPGAPANKALPTQSWQVLPTANDWPVWTRTGGMGSLLLFGRAGTTGADTAAAFGAPKVFTPYDPSVHSLTGKIGQLDDATLYAVSVRVKVCVNSASVKPEPNCRQYGNYYKPEGLIQKYQDGLRYSLFSYLNDDAQTRDGGVMRARQKYVGPMTYDPIEGVRPNPRAEWDPVTGIQYRNPDASDSAATNTRIGTSAVINSGVINYINKFAQTTGEKPKSIDPVSELFYTAIRYAKKQGNVSAYSDMAAVNALKFTDLFPVITDWDDPQQYTCQLNAAIGIGDVNTWLDRNLPGTTTRSKEPTKPSEVENDKTIELDKAYQKLVELEAAEGVVLPPLAESFTVKVRPTDADRGNSGFLAALAYDAHTRDLRPDIPGVQTLSSYWVDVAENKVVMKRERNQYYLAAKYGGFDVPEGFDPYARTTALPETWWVARNASGAAEYVGVGDLAGAKRPQNFFLANRAETMIDSLSRAFKAAAAQPRRGAAAIVGTNGATLQEGAVVYIPTYYTDWSGELSAYNVDKQTNALSPLWQAGDRLPAPAARKIYANSNGYGVFTWARLDSEDRGNIGSEAVLDYLRGDRGNEVRNGGGLRDRGGVLGDFVNSSPLYVGKPSGTLYATSGFLGGGAAYAKYAADKALRTPVVYVGGNDGMLHGFNANTGEETYAFVPASVLKLKNALADYAKPAYRDAHRYFVDGELTVADVYTGGAWRTILVGTLGRGGKGVFALDITDPNAVQFLWEKYDTQIPELGNNLGKPVVVQTANGVWKVLLGNGPNSTGGSAQMLVIDAASGAVSAVGTGAGQDNGLSGVRPWDANRDGFYETAYAGDLKGNVWRFSGLGAGTTPTSATIFTASAGQAITAAPQVAFKPDSTETWVFFGTGRYLDRTDLGDKTVQSWYGIIDRGGTVRTDRAKLVGRAIEFEGAIKNAKGENVTVRVIAAAANGDMVGKDGWYIDLVSPGPLARGERMVVPNLFDGNRLLGITRIPVMGNPCEPGGSGFTMEIDPFSGGRLKESVFDVNGDGKIDAGDLAGGGAGGKPVSGIGNSTAPNGAVIIPGRDGNLIVNTDDAGDPRTLRTPVLGLGARRVSWREVVRDTQ